MKKKKTGICKICKEVKVLSYEHFPPRSAFNKDTRFVKLDTFEYYQNFENYINGEIPNAKPEQGGLGDYCLCKNCNNELGLKYVKDYTNFAKICQNVIDSKEEFNYTIKIKREEINLKNFLKQITSIFICNNDLWFTELYPELLEFVKNENYCQLPNKYRFYMFLNNEGQIKSGIRTFDSLNGEIYEFVFPPFGFILNIENNNQIVELLEITDIKNFEKSDKKEYIFYLNKYPTYSPYPPYPLDCRGRDEFIDY